MDRIEIRGLRAFGYHGVYESEREHGQTFVVDVDLDLDLRAPAASDDLADTVDYGALAERLGEAVATTRYDLIEALAAHLAELALGEPMIRGARVRIAKPEARLSVECQDVAVVVARGGP